MPNVRRGQGSGDTGLNLATVATPQETHVQPQGAPRHPRPARAGRRGRPAGSGGVPGRSRKGRPRQEGPSKSRTLGSPASEGPPAPTQTLLCAPVPPPSVQLWGSPRPQPPPLRARSQAGPSVQAEGAPPGWGGGGGRVDMVGGGAGASSRQPHQPRRFLGPRCKWGGDQRSLRTGARPTGPQAIPDASLEVGAAHPQPFLWPQHVAVGEWVPVRLHVQITPFLLF